MKLYKDKKVTFVELPGSDLHRYILQRKKDSEPEQIIGVTSLMKKMGLSKSYASANPDVLARAAARGTAIHELFQGYELGTTVVASIHYEWTKMDGTTESADEDVTKMLEAYRKLSAENFKCAAIEYMVSDDDCVASLVDLVSEVDENTVDLIDYKSSGTLDKKGLSWQLSFYKYLFERQNKKIKVRNLLGVHCHDKNVKVVPVPYQGDETVAGVLQAYRNGCDNVVPESQEVVTLGDLVPGYPELGEILKLKRELQTKIDELDEVSKDMVAELKERMAERRINEVPVPGGRFVLIAEHDVTKLNTALLKEYEPAIYDKYCVTTRASASLRFMKDK